MTDNLNTSMQHTNVQITSKIIKLTSPFTFDGKTYNEVTVNNPKVRDLRLLDQDGKDVEKSITLASALTGLPDLVIEEISGYDWQKIQEAIAYFLKNAPKTTKK